MEKNVPDSDGHSDQVTVTRDENTGILESADGNNYHIEVTLDEREVIEGETELSVEELVKGVENYEDYLQAISESMCLESTGEIQFVRLFDIKIFVNGELFEPTYPAKVSISYDEEISLDMIRV